MARLGGDGDVSAKITTEYDGKGLEEAKKDMASITASANSMGDSSNKVSRELKKMGDASEWVGGGLKRFRGILEGMAFGAVVGAVSAVTAELIRHYKESTITKEKIDELNKSVMEQAKAWKLLPEPIGNVTRATIDLYNAQLRYDQHLERNSGKELENQIELTEKAKKMRQEAMGKVVGPLAASIRETWANEILEADVMLAELRKKLEDWNSLMAQKTVTAATVKAALSGEAAAAFSGAILAGGGYLEELKKSPGERLMGAGEGISFDVNAKLRPLMLYYEELSAGERDYNKRLVELAAEREAAITRLAEIERESPYNRGGGPIGEAYSKGFGEKHDAEILAMQDFNSRKLQLMVDAGAAQFEIEMEYERMTTRMKQQEYQSRLVFASVMIGSMANLFQNLYVASGKKNREMFEAGKIFAIAQATVDTYTGATAAYKALAGIPVVGPALATAAAASIIAAGLANVKTIASTQPGGGAIGAGGAAMPSYSGGSYEAYPVPQKIEESKAKPQIVFKIEHMELLDENSVILLMERISKMARDYDVTLEATGVA